jgi:hypothetical protein
MFYLILFCLNHDWEPVYARIDAVYLIPEPFILRKLFLILWRINRSFPTAIFVGTSSRGDTVIITFKYVLVIPPPYLCLSGAAI